ncbi:MAG: HD domain-containing protein [Gemmatimonadales bacterium]
MPDRGSLLLRRRWNSLVERLGCAAADSWDLVVNGYAEPHRAYHTLSHIEDCLSLLDATPDVPARDLVEAALWLHDVVYDPKKDDNEEKSAAVAARLLSNLGADRAAVKAVEEYIRLTRHDRGALKGPGAWVVDIDLAILGAGPEAFARYENTIRREYSWLDPARYRKGRIAVLGKFMNRTRIYQTDYFDKLLDARARNNLKDAIGRLAGAVTQ